MNSPINRQQVLSSNTDFSNNIINNLNCPDIGVRIEDSCFRFDSDEWVFDLLVTRMDDSKEYELVIEFEGDSSSDQYIWSQPGSNSDFTKIIPQDSISVTPEDVNKILFHPYECDRFRDTAGYHVCGNNKPNPKFVVSPSNPDPGEEVTFDASSSEDYDGNITSYEWSLGDGKSGEVVSHSFSEETYYDVTLTVTDDVGQTQSETKAVGVGDPVITGCADVGVRVNSYEFQAKGEELQFDLQLTRASDSGIYLLAVDLETESGSDQYTWEHKGKYSDFKETISQEEVSVDISCVNKIVYHVYDCERYRDRVSIDPVYCDYTPSTGKITGDVTEENGNSITGNAYLIDTTYENAVIDYTEDQGPLPETEVETAVEAGEFQFSNIETGRYLVLVDPTDPFDPEYTEISVEVDKETTISMTVDADRYLSKLDSEFDRLKIAAEDIIMDSTDDVAGVYVDGARLFRDDLSEEDFLLGMLKVTDFTLDLAGGVSSVGAEITNFAAEQTTVTFAEQGYNQVLATQFEEVEGTTFKNDLGSYTEQCLQTDWITNLDQTDAKSIAKEAFQGTPMYSTALEDIEKATTEYNDIAYEEPADDFSFAAVKSILKTQARWLENNGAAPGVLITPRSNGYITRESNYHAGHYNALRENFEIAEAGETAATGVSAVGNGIAVVSSASGVGAAVGGAVSVIGSLGSLAFSMYQVKLKNDLGGAWVNSLRYWLSDLDDASLVLFDILAWIEEEITNPSLQDVDGQILSTDLGGVKYNGRTYAPANAPDYPLWWTTLPTPQWKRRATNTVSLENTGKTTTTFQVISVDTYGDGKSDSVSDAVSMYPDDDMSIDDATLDPGESTEIAFEYSADFHPFDPFNWHHMSTSLWMNGKVVDEVEDLYYIVPSTDVLSLSSSHSQKLDVEKSLTATDMLKEPIETDSYFLTDGSKPSGEPMTVDDWSQHVGDIEILVEGIVTPSDNTITTEYEVPTNVRGVAFTLSSPPDIELNIGVEDDQGRFVGYDPDEDKPVVEIPTAEYNGHENALEVVSIAEASGTYTVDARAVNFLGDDSASIALHTVEIPEREASMAVSPATADMVIEPSTTVTTQIEIGEAGGQVDMEVTNVQISDLQTINGDPLSDVAVSLSDSSLTVPAGDQKIIEITADAAADIALPDGPETRFHGTLTIETSNAGMAELDTSILVFDTDDEQVELADFGPNVEGITVRLTESPPSEPPDNVVVIDSYDVETTGEDATKLTFPYQKPEAGERVTAYQVDEEWTELDTSVGERLSVEVPVQGTTNITLGTDEADLIPSVSATGDIIPQAGQAEISIDASNVETISVEKLWTDWEVVETQTDGGSFTESIKTTGTCEFSWEAVQDYATVKLVISPPDRYLGGEYVLAVDGENMEGSMESTITVEITSNGSS